MPHYLKFLLLLFLSTQVIAENNQAKINQLYNSGLQMQLSQQYEKSLEYFLKVVELSPVDWQARTKLIQVYQALGRKEERDKQRKILFDLKQKGQIASLNEEKLYCRDQFEIGEHKVFALEYFSLTGERALRYSFHVLDKQSKDYQYKITLGSYNYMTEFMRADGRLQADQRAFHLDGYFPEKEHRTYDFFKGEPSYDSIRNMVVEILEGKRTAISGSQGGTINLSP